LSPDFSRPSRSPEEIFAAFLARTRSGGDGDLEALYAEHPECTDMLRRMAEGCAEANALIGRMRSSGRWMGFFRRGAEEHAPKGGFSPGYREGDTIGDFHLLRLIGSGGQGQVWEAEQASLGRRVALKLVLPARIDRRRIEFFAREARAGGRLAHPGIVAVHAFGESDGVHWIAQELIHGGWTLRDLIDEMHIAKDRPSDYYERVTEFVVKLADALQAAHDAGVIHRDIKPQNVLITSDDEPKVTDFGMALITDESSLSTTGDVAGTYLYMSPEQVMAKRMGIDHRTDIFSLGIVLYEMLALQRPFEGDTMHQIVEKIVTWDPPDLHKLRSRVPMELAVIAAKALEKRREDRYQTMSDFAADLRRHLANEPIRAKPPGMVRRTRKWALRNRTKSVAATLVIVAFIVISGLALRLFHFSNEAQASALAERQRADEVLRLSALQTYDDLITEVDGLWPPYPDRIDDYRSWIDRMSALVDELPGFVRKREELRAFALPQTGDPGSVDSGGRPVDAELDALSGRIASMRAALRQRRDGIAVKLPGVAWTGGPAADMNDHAWDMVRPNRTVYGEEVVGLALALQALERATPEERFEILDTVSRAFFALGRDDEALAASQDALREAPDERRAEYEGHLRNLEGWIAEASSEPGMRSAEEELAAREAEYDTLQRKASERQDWSFPEERSYSRWWNSQLTKLIDRLESVQDPETGLLSEDGICPEHGWSVGKRLELARRLAAGFAAGGEFEVRWKAVLPEIREDYSGLELSVQMALVPIGADLESGLWEFWHVQSGEEPERGADGELIITAKTGMVFVLLPGGLYWRGAQDNPSGQNHDPNAIEDELPVREVDVSAFFLSKYEMTQGQWVRTTGRNPSHWTFENEADPKGPSHPVEQISWQECRAVLPHLGLVLPSEAQWEYGCRGATTSPWPFPREAFATFANIADREYDRAFRTTIMTEPWNDGFWSHGPVGRLLPDGFGLHDTIGGVSEWCRDEYDLGFYWVDLGPDPVCPPQGLRYRVTRGGSFQDLAIVARSAARGAETPEFAGLYLGVRPARLVED